MFICDILRRHLLLVAFYVPTGTRTKIIMEAKVQIVPCLVLWILMPSPPPISQAFPSDRYAVRSQVQLRGLDPDACIVEVSPREGEQVQQCTRICRRQSEWPFCNWR